MRRLLLVAMAVVAGSLALAPAAHAGWDQDQGYHRGWSHDDDRNWHRWHRQREHEARERAYRQGYANGWERGREDDWRRFHPAPPPPPAPLPTPPRTRFYFGYGQER